MDRSLRVLAGRLSTDARVCTGVHGRFGRRLAAEPVVRTETSSSIFVFDDLFSRRRPSHYGFYARSREQAASGERGVAAGEQQGDSRGDTRGYPGQRNLDEWGQVQGAKSPGELALTEMKIRLYPTQPVISRNADTLAAQGNLRTS